MKITKEMLEEKKAWPEDIEWFIERFGNEAEHEDILKKLYEEKNCYGWASWLFENFKLSGELKVFGINGVLWQHGHFIDGKLNGEYKTFYENEKLRIHSYYIDGRLSGEYKIFDDNENLRAHFHYKDGKLVKENLINKDI